MLLKDFRESRILLTTINSHGNHVEDEKEIVLQVSESGKDSMSTTNNLTDQQEIKDRVNNK